MDWFWGGNSSPFPFFRFSSQLTINLRTGTNKENPTV